MATPFDSIGGLLGIDPAQLQQLMAQFAPSEDDRKAANMQALAQLGFGLLGTRKGYEWDQVGNAAQNALQARQGALQGAQQGKADLFKTAQGLAKYKGEQDAAKRKQQYADGLINVVPSAQSGANQGGTRAYLMSIGVPPEAIAVAAQSADPAAAVGKLIEHYTNPVFGQGKIPLVRTQGGYKAVVPEGYRDALSAQTSAETGAQEGAKAEFDLVQVPQSDGSTRMMTRAQAVQYFGGGNVPNGGGSGGGPALGVSANPQQVKQEDAALAVQTEQNKKIVGGQADDYMAVLNAERSAPNNIGKLQLLKSHLANVDTGKAAPVVQNLKAYASYIAPELSKDWTKDTPYAQAASALSNELALQLRNPQGGAGMPGALSDSDRQFLVSMTASVANDPRAIPMMVDARIALEKRSQDIGKIARDYRNRHDRIDEGFYAAIADFASREPLFSGMQMPSTAAPAPRTVIKYDKNGRRIQ